MGRQRRGVGLWYGSIAITLFAMQEFEIGKEGKERRGEGRRNGPSREQDKTSGEE
jgi:hypothetical protein